METSRPCAAPYVCIDHECASAPADAADAGSASCTADTECPVTAPHCAAGGICVACDDSAQCSADKPVCDPGTNTCRGCTSDTECPSNACNLDSGVCRSSADVIYASPAGVTTGTCTQAAPCALDHAFAVIDATRFVVRMLPGSYAGNVSIVGKQVVIDGYGATLNGGNAAPALAATDGANVRLGGLTILYLTASSGGTAVDCRVATAGAAVPTLYLADVAVDSSAAVAAAIGCNLTVADSRFHGRSPDAAAIVCADPSVTTITRSMIDGGGGIVSLGAGSSMGITNSIIANQVNAQGSLVGGSFGTGAAGSLSVSFSTIINSPIKCTTGIPACANGTAAGVCVANSIIIGTGGDQVTGSACQMSYDLIMPQAVAPPGNNRVNIDPLFVDAANKNYALKPSSPAIDSADPSATPPATDYAGTPRPQGPRSDVGAFEYKP